MEVTQDSIAKFIEIVQSNQPIGEEELSVVISILHSAGFGNITALAKKPVEDYMRDQDGSKTGEPFSLNSFSEIAALRGKEEDQVATIWLNSIWSFTKSTWKDEPDLVKKVQKAILDSIPLKPVILTEFGEALLEYPPQCHGIHTTHTDDDCELRSCIGVHDLCKGWMDLYTISSTHNAVVCRKCHLRVLIPNTLKTYGDLRKHFAKYNG